VKVIEAYLTALAGVLEQCKNSTNQNINSCNDDDDLLNETASEHITDYYRYISRQLFKSEYLFELFLGKCGKYSDNKQLLKLSKTVTRHLSVMAKTLSERDVDVSDVIDHRYTDQLTAVLTDVINRSRTWNVDLIHVVDGFWSVISSHLRCNLLASLVNETGDCLENLDDTESCNLNSRGLLVVRLLNSLSAEDWACISSEVISCLFEIVKRVPSDSGFCESMSRSVSIAPRLSYNRDVQETCLLLLRNGCHSALSLVSSLSTANATCRQSLINWFMTKSKRWSKPQVQPVFSHLIMSTLKSFKEGLVFYFLSDFEAIVPIFFVSW